jgi:DNA-directed RNA polymerase specialized sigma24 family protein
VGGGWPAGRVKPARDPAEELALVAQAKRELLLRANRFRLGRQDLEDCYSQATLELLVRARRGGAFEDRRRLGIALEMRFLSRVADRRRALAGRSPIEAALHDAAPLGGVGDEHVVDPRADVEKLVILRQDLRRVELLARELTADQRLVLASQVGLAHTCGDFCRCFGWSPEKYRKVAQRARKRLRRLMTVEGPDVPTSGVGRRRQ